MIKRTMLTVFLIGFSLAAMAQGKFLIVPVIGFYSGSYTGVDSINARQKFIRTKRFAGKDLKIGIKMNFTQQKYSFTLGVESMNYNSGFIHREPDEKPDRINFRESLSQGSLWGIIIESKYRLLTFKTLQPRWLAKNKSGDQMFFFSNKVSPLFGMEFRRMGPTFVQDFEESSVILTSTHGSIPGTNYFHSDNRNHFALRCGVEWGFYDARDKYRFSLSVFYSFAFKDAGYFYYHFAKPSSGIDFNFKNTTRGNGFTIFAGLPIKLFELKNNKAG